MTNKFQLVALTLLASLSCGAFVGARGIYETTEGRYSEVSRAMLASGNFLEPTLMDHPHWSKPPVTYWLMAAGIHTFGRTAGAVRYPNVLLFVGTTLLVAGIADRLFQDNTGWVAGAVFATSPMTVFTAGVASTDMPLTFFETAAVLAYVGAFTTPARSRRWVLAMWFFAAAAFMTKGPPSLLPLIPVALWHAWHVRASSLRLLDPIGIGIFVLVGFSWYAAMAWRHPEVLDLWIGREIVGRFVDRGGHHNSQWYGAFMIYVPVLAIGNGAWTWFMARSVLRDRLWRWTTIRRQVADGTPYGFLLLWVAIPVAVFFVVDSRLVPYLLPTFVPLSILAGRAVAAGWRTPGPRATAAVAAASAIVFVGIRAAFPYVVNTDKDMRALYELTRQAGAESAQVYSFEKTNRGLRFYLDGNLQRVSLAENGGRNLPVAAALEAGPPWVFVSQRSKADGLRPALNRAGTTYRTLQDEHWTVFTTVGTGGGTRHTRFQPHNPANSPGNPVDISELSDYTESTVNRSRPNDQYMLRFGR